MQAIKGLAIGATMFAAQSAAAVDAPSAFKISAIIGLSGPLGVIGATRAAASRWRWPKLTRARREAQTFMPVGAAGALLMRAAR